MKMVDGRFCEVKRQDAASTLGWSTLLDVVLGMGDKGWK